MNALTAAIVIAAAVAIILIAMKHHGDRIIDEILGAELREIDRRRQAGIQSGFDAGWHGGSDRR